MRFRVQPSSEIRRRVDLSFPIGFLLTNLVPVSKLGAGRKELLNLSALMMLLATMTLLTMMTMNGAKANSRASTHCHSCLWSDPSSSQQNLCSTFSWHSSSTTSNCSSFDVAVDSVGDAMKASESEGRGSKRVDMLVEML